MKLPLTRYIILLFLLTAICVASSSWFQRLRLKIISSFSSPLAENIPLQSQEQSLIAENITLRHQTATLSWEILQLKEQVNNLTTFREKFSLEKFPLVVPASIIFQKDTSSAFRRTFLINRGSKDKIKVGSPVVSGSTLVGRIAEVEKNTSRVVAISDPSMRIGIEVIGTSSDGTPKSYAKGMCIGKNSEFCELRNVEKDVVKWPSGILNIVTSGFRDQYPAGLIVGTIQSPYYSTSDQQLSPPDTGVFWDLPVEIQSVSQLKTVLVLLNQ